MNRSILVDEHERRNARLIPDPERPRVLTYGDVPAEYAAGTSGCVLFDETDRGLLRVTGGERQVFLHRLMSNEVRSLEPGRGNRNLLLTSKGKVQHDVDLSVDAEEVRLSCPPGEAAALRTALDMYLFTEDVQLEDDTESYAPIALCGPRTAGVAEAVLGEAPAVDDHAWRSLTVEGETTRLSAVPVAGSPGLRIEAPPSLAPTLWSRLIDAGAQPAGAVAADSLRCEAGHALFGADVSDAIYPQEARLEAAFSLEKGCYIGQEVVAKIDTYGGLNKCIVPLRVEHDDPIAPGTRLFREDGGEWRDLGVATSWAYSFALDTGLVLAYVKRRHQAAGTGFRLGGPDGPAAEVVAPPLRAHALAPTGAFEEPDASE